MSYLSLDPKAKHKIVRGQWGKKLKGISLQEILKMFRKTPTHKKRISLQSPLLQYQTRGQGDPRRILEEVIGY